jgi:hypothetical protein
MAVPWKVMNKIRKAVLEEIGGTDDRFVTESGEVIQLAERFFTLHHDTGEIVSNVKLHGRHFIFDLEGTLIDIHRD